MLVDEPFVRNPLPVRMGVTAAGAGRAPLLRQRDKVDAAFDAALLRWTAAVVRNRRAIFDGGDLQASGVKGSDGALATRTRALDAHFHFLHAKTTRLAGGLLARAARRKRRALAGALESNAAS